MRAAITLAEYGLHPILLDEAPRSGGQIYRRQPEGFIRDDQTFYGFDAKRARRLHDAFDALGDRIDHRSGTLVWNVERGHLQVLRDGRSETIRYDRLVLATGAMDRIIPFPGWTLPGVFTLGGAQIALKYQACGIGRRVVFFGSSPLLPLVASQYAVAGIDVAGVLDTTPLGAKLTALPRLMIGSATGWKGAAFLSRLALRGIPYRHGVVPVAALGTASVTGFAYMDTVGRRHEIACDAIAFGYGLKSEWQLADLAGCRFVFDHQTHQWRVDEDGEGRSSVPGIYLAGDGARIGGVEIAEMTGERAARALLSDVGQGNQADGLGRIAIRIARQAGLRRAIDAAFPFPARLARAVPDDCILCRCEAVKAGEFRSAIASLSADDVNRAKAFSRVGMGRCQGRICGPAAAEILAGALGCTTEEAGRLRSQPPAKPVPVAAVAQLSGKMA